MSTIDLPLFGTTDLNAVPVDEDGVLVTDHVWQGHTVRCELWLGKTEVVWDEPETQTGAFEVHAAPIDQPLTWPQADADAMAPLLAQADLWLQRSRELIVQAAQDEDSEAFTYIDHHRSELPALATLSDEAFWQRLRLAFVAYPCELDDGAVITVDWTIDPSFEQTQYLMCVRLDAQGQCVDVAMES